MKLTTILLCLAGVLSAQQTPVIQTETREVLVDAIVTAKNGAYIRDLSSKDFRVSQDGKEQTIKGFELESASAAAQPRSLILFFDETSMEARDQIQVRQAAASFIDAEAAPNHMMAVITFNGSLRVAQNFTNNAGRLKDALAQASFHGLAPSAADSDRSHDPSRTEEDRLVGHATGSSLATSMGVRNMLHALGDLGRSLDVLPGRKIVVVFTGTLVSSTDPKSELRDAVEAANKSGVAFYPVDVRPGFAQTDPGGAPVPAQRSPYMQRGGSPGGGPKGDADDLGSPVPDSGSYSQQLLFGLANGTGGFVVLNASDLLGELQKIAQEQEQYYALTYVAPESKEGTCHSIRVKVDRKATTVRSRTSYCTSKPMDLLAGTTAAKELDQRATAPETGDIGASIELPYFYTAPNVARVQVAMEIQADKLKFENRKGRQHAELNFLGIAAGADGEVRARFSDALKLDFDNPSQIENLKGKSLHYEKEFKIVPGQYTFTVAFTQGDASFGKVQMPLAIEPWTGEFGLSGLALSRETHPAADLGLSLGLEGRTPLVADGMQVIPSGSWQFTKSQPAYFYFEVYGAGAAGARAHLRILDRKSGEQKWDGGSLTLTSRSNSGKLATDSLAAGSYRLEITANDLKRTADFDLY